MKTLSEHKTALKNKKAERGGTADHCRLSTSSCKPDFGITKTAQRRQRVYYDPCEETSINNI